MKTNAGFSMIEMLVAIAVSMIIMASVYSVFLSQQKSTVVQTNVSDIQQNLRAAMDFLARDIRMAGYAGPEQGGVGDFGFANAGGGFAQFSWDMNDNGLVDLDETVTYSLSNSSDVAPGSSALMRDGQPMAGYVINLSLAYAYDADLDGELDKDGSGNVIWAVAAGSDDEWPNGYWTTVDGTGTGTPVHYQDIRAVRIWLLGRSEAPDNTYTDNNIYVVGSQAIQPNDNFRHRLLERTVLCRNMGFKK